MKRYLVFVGSDYYPLGGWGDFVGDYNTLEEARLRALNKKEDWYQIIDSTNKQIVGTHLY